MPQVVDLEALVCGGGDGKVSCETSLPQDSPVSASPAKGMDEPAESFRLPFKEEIDWVDRNAAPFFDRDDSTKEVTNPKSANHHFSGNLGTNPRANSTSQRFAGKPKAPIIALPNKLRHSGYLGHSRRHAPIFPKKGQQGIKPPAPESEPTSPKVSCMGRVLSDRDRRRFRRRTPTPAPAPVPSTTTVRKRSGFWTAICRVSCFRRPRRSAAVDDDGLPSSRNTTTTTKDGSTPREDADGEAPAAPPGMGLGAMKRFTSGRRSESWADELDHGSKSGPLLKNDPGVLGRRMAGSLQDLDCERDWKSSGPASV
ncbi:unnamed protein product [Spirodela intermedia]|uniref:Uncharacterized protein n=1 Tax=Spirodela intermedia TaxID=51605 RepID=A0A7I8ISD4_SPIIN|nr:unnamed protein product [Spirodela intermedia]CAA6660665.1 unnamed protein product [Spirodela intermedia]